MHGLRAHPHGGLAVRPHVAAVRTQKITPAPHGETSARKRGELVGRLIAQEYQRTVLPVTPAAVAVELRRLAGELEGA